MNYDLTTAISNALKAKQILDECREQSGNEYSYHCYYPEQEYANAENDLKALIKDLIKEELKADVQGVYSQADLVEKG